MFAVREMPLTYFISFCILLELMMWLALWLMYRKQKFICFNPADYHVHVKGHAPKSSGDTTFEPLMRQYFDLAKILITLSGASIAFGPLDPERIGIYQAKLMLAFSAFYCILFCLTCLKFYEDYTHEVTSYTPARVSLVESLGLSGVLLFFLAYAWWAAYVSHAANH